MGDRSRRFIWRRLPCHQGPLPVTANRSASHRTASKRNVTYRSCMHARTHVHTRIRQRPSRTAPEAAAAAATTSCTRMRLLLSFGGVHVYRRRSGQIVSSSDSTPFVGRAFASVVCFSVSQPFTPSRTCSPVSVAKLNSHQSVCRIISVVMGLVSYLPAANVAVHVMGAVVFVYSVYFNYAHVNIPVKVNPIDDAFGGKFKYLTFLDGVSPLHGAR